MLRNTYVQHLLKQIGCLQVQPIPKRVCFADFIAGGTLIEYLKG
jgi:hypothetical protein